MGYEEYNEFLEACLEAAWKLQDSCPWSREEDDILVYKLEIQYICFLMEQT